MNFKAVIAAVAVTLAGVAPANAGGFADMMRGFEAGMGQGMGSDMTGIMNQAIGQNNGPRYARFCNARQMVYVGNTMMTFTCRAYTGRSYTYNNSAVF